MGRHKDAIPSQRIRLDGYQRFPILDERDQVALDWYLKNRSERKAFPIAWELIKAALNGELGSGVKFAVESASEEELRKQMEAAKDIMANFVVEDI